MKRNNKRKFLRAAFIFTLMVGYGSALYGQSILRNIPSEVNVDSKYLFFLHGQIVEDKGIRPLSEKYGVYEYEKILETFKDAGFVVISEARTEKTDVLSYAKNLSNQINKLLKSGIPPHSIMVVGASKGGFIAMIVSSILKNKDINYVFLAACHKKLIKDILDEGMVPHGNMLSIYDVKDDLAESCRGLFEESEEGTSIGLREIAINTGLGHGFHYKPLDDWIRPVINMAYERDDIDENGRSIRKKRKPVEQFIGTDLEIKEVVAGPFLSDEEAFGGFGGELPEGMLLLRSDATLMETGYFILKSVSVIDTGDLQDIRKAKTKQGIPHLEFSLNARGSDRLQEFTSKNRGKIMAFVIGGDIVMVQKIDTVMSSKATIEARFTDETADDIVNNVKKSIRHKNIKR